TRVAAPGTSCSSGSSGRASSWAWAELPEEHERAQRSPGRAREPGHDPRGAAAAELAPGEQAEWIAGSGDGARLDARRRPDEGDARAPGGERVGERQAWEEV